jgi:cytochrome c peroxidase
LLWLCLTAVALPGAAAAQTGAPNPTRAQVYGRAAALESLGRKMFADPLLSGSGQVACASCHSPDHAFGPPNDLAVQLGGKDRRQLGFRAAPSLRYLQAVPQFTEHYYESEDEADGSADRRLDLGRSRRSPPRSGTHSSALTLRNGE